MDAAFAFSSPLPSLKGLSRVSQRRKVSIVVSAQIQRWQNEDGAFQTSAVDRNMGLLRERMEVVRKRESLQKWHTKQEWEYLLKSEEDLRTVNGLNHFLESSERMARNLALAFLCSTVYRCLASAAARMAE